MLTIENSDVTIGFCGVGQMGAPMAARLIKAGFNVRVWNRTPQRVAPLVELGAVAASSPSEAATGADFLVTMLPDGPSVETVMSGPDGALAMLRKGAVWLQMSSVGVEWATKFADLVVTNGVEYVDAPVSGSVGPAESGSLLILASGPDFEQAQAAQVFDALARRTLWLGAAGAGSRAKLVLNNWLVGLVEATAEMLHFSTALGLDPEIIVEVLADAPIGSPYAVAKARQMLEGDYTSSFALKHALKDADLSVAAANEVGTDLRMTKSFIESWHRAVSNGLGDQDIAVIYTNGLEEA
jgi:3-hydroxyisobutyrate dehydrogenase